MTHWPRSWDYPDEDEDDEMGSMGRACAEYEEKLMLMQDAAPDMAKALTEIWEMDPDEPYECIRAMQKIALEALKKAHLTLETEGRS